jgi:hypothetical protein
MRFTHQTLALGTPVTSVVGEHLDDARAAYDEAAAGTGRNRHGSTVGRRRACDNRRRAEFADRYQVLTG